MFSSLRTYSLSSAKVAHHAIPFVACRTIAAKQDPEQTLPELSPAREG
jgi:hypothetical protein